MQSFISGVKKFLTENNKAFKKLLLLDNVGSHDESLKTLHPDVEVEFLPANTTSLLQPMDQSVIPTFKTHYSRRFIDNMLRSINYECQNLIPSFKVKNF